MHEYIKRSDAIAEINRGDLLVGNNAEWAREIIWRTPYADVVEVVHAQWEYDLKTQFWGNPYRCTACKRANDVKSNYCPNCGAHMRETYLGNCGY